MPEDRSLTAMDYIHEVRTCVIEMVIFSGNFTSLINVQVVKCVWVVGNAGRHECTLKFGVSAVTGSYGLRTSHKCWTFLNKYFYWLFLLRHICYAIWALRWTSQYNRWLHFGRRINWNTNPSSYRDSFACTAFRLAMGPTQPPVQSISGVKWPGCEAHYSFYNRVK